MAILNFDPRQVEPNQVFDPLPTSWYTGQIVESELKQNSNKNGHYLKLKVQVMGGDYNGRTVFDQLNLDNPNQQTVDIAYRTLSAICHAVGKGQQEVQDSQMLHGIPLLFKVNERPARTDPVTGTRYDAGNEIKGYKAIDPTAAPVLGPSKAQQPGFGAARGGPSGPPTGFNGAAAPAAQPQQNWNNAAPGGWGGAQGAGQPNGGAPMGNGTIPMGGPAAQPVQPQANVNAPQFQQPQQQQPVVQAQQPVQAQPQTNVGNPNLAAGTPPPWAQQQPAANGSGGASPPWQK
jgi:Protein of unknown function (DUF669)